MLSLTCTASREGLVLALTRAPPEPASVLTRVLASERVRTSAGPRLLRETARHINLALDERHTKWAPLDGRRYATESTRFVWETLPHIMP